MWKEDQRYIWDHEPHVRVPGAGEGVLLEAREALAGHFWTKFMKQKLLGTKGLVGVELPSGVLQRGSAAMVPWPICPKLATCVGHNKLNATVMPSTCPSMTEKV